MEKFLAHRVWFLGEDVSLPFSAVTEAIARPIAGGMLAVSSRLRRIVPELSLDLLAGVFGPAEVVDRLRSSLPAHADRDECCIAAPLAIGE